MLEVDGVHVAYGSAPAVAGVSLWVSPGELVCVVGPNGAGKTTLIHALAGILPTSAGRIAKNGVDLTRRAPHRWCAAGIAVVPEGRRLFTGMTVRENLDIGSYLPAARAVRRATLEQVTTLFPVLRGRLESPAGELSGGQQQMLAIARALMARPSLLLLDEPSLGLAPAIVADLFDAIRRINAEGVSVLLVEQNVAIAMQVATRAYVLEEGRIVAEGASHELMARPEIRRAYLGV